MKIKKPNVRAERNINIKENDKRGNETGKRIIE